MAARNAFSKFPLLKVSATGNDFLLVDLLSAKNAAGWKKEFGRKPRRHWVKTWCHRQEGLGADGMVFLEKSKDHDFQWDFYNSDGSSAEMCGNAARAVSLYAHKTLKKSSLKFQTRVGTVLAKIKTEKNIEVRLPAIAENQWNQLMSWKGAQLGFDFVRAGVPHVVAQVPTLDERQTLREIALEIKRQPAFVKDGTNVTFVRLVSAQEIQSVTFERGVEDFTLSCGTGAVAAAHSVLRGEENQAVEVQVPGGVLTVVWKEGYPYLRGPAKIIAEIHVCP